MKRSGCEMENNKGSGDSGDSVRCGGRMKGGREMGKPGNNPRCKE